MSTHATSALELIHSDPELRVSKVTPGVPAWSAILNQHHRFLRYEPLDAGAIAQRQLLVWSAGSRVKLQAPCMKVWSMRLAGCAHDHAHGQLRRGVVKQWSFEINRSSLYN